MKRIGIAGVALVAGGLLFASGAWWSRGRPAGAAQTAQSVAWTCPMHPEYRTDRPGDCPLCGMRLDRAEAGSRAGTIPLPSGAVHVTADRQQAIGVTLGVAERVSGVRTLRTTGRVAANENATYPVVAGTSGWIRSLGGATTGSLVRKNEILASLYSPEFVNAQQSYYTGLETVAVATGPELRAYNQNRVVESVQRSADILRNLGVSEAQLADMRRSRKLTQDIHVVSPIDGFVLQRNISAGMRFDRGFEFYRIADLASVWILADVYQHQQRFIRPGASARVTASPADPPFTAVVSRSEAVFDESTLTLKVRLESANPGLLLKPGMFVDVEFAVELPDTLVVPSDAIVDSGQRKTVFVARANGYFEPREVETGWRIGDRVEIVRGVMPGDRIVISGTFLIDSESRMKAAAGRGRASQTGGTAIDPVCGMTVESDAAHAAGRSREHDGRRYVFCADQCARRFDENPGQFASVR